MKLLSSLLSEKYLHGARAPLYHWTSINFLDDIIRLDGVGNTEEWSPLKGAGKLSRGWLSMTRDKQYQKHYGTKDESARLEFDGELIHRDFKVRPYVDQTVVKNRRDPLSQHERRWESEEKVFGPIKPLDKYLLSIQITRKAYDTLMDRRNKFEQHAAEHKRAAEKFKRELIKMGPAHHTYPDQYITFNQFVDGLRDPKRGKKFIDQRGQSLNKPSPYLRSIAELDKILNHPKLEVNEVI